MTKELKEKWSAITAEYCRMVNDGTRDKLPYNVQELIHKMASAMQDAICADSRAKMKAQLTRNENKYWRTL